MFGRKRKAAPNGGPTMRQAVALYKPMTCACGPECPGHWVEMATPWWPSDFTPTAEECADSDLLRSAWMRYLSDPNSSRTTSSSF